MPAVPASPFPRCGDGRARPASIFNTEQRKGHRMSTIAERARAEADEAEQENPDAEPVEPIEPEEEEEAETPPEPVEPPSSLAQIEAQDKALTAEQKRHANALAKALGDQWAAFEQCPLCQVDGYAIPYQPGEVSPEQRAAISFVMGEGGGPQLKPHPDLEMCSFCDGWGELLTGSKRDVGKTEICPRCSASGYVAKNTAPAATNGASQWTPPAPSAPVYDLSNVNKDQWGRTADNPYYGQDPATNGGVWS